MDDTDREAIEQKMLREGRIKKPFSKHRRSYAIWYYSVQRQCDEAVNEFDGDGEDLMDYVENISSLLTFGPNPRSFDPPIRPDDVGFPADPS